MSPDDIPAEKVQEDTKKIASAMNKAGNPLDIEHQCWQIDAWLLDETEESKPLVEDQMDEQMDKENISLIQATEGFKKTVQDMQQEEEEPVKRPQASHRVQLEEN